MNMSAAQPQSQTRDLDPNVAQRRASNPKSSVWVSASAGTGKTKVLTDRILRLLLPAGQEQPGTHAHRILGITFTKAAASEMALRINETLAQWAVSNEEELQSTLKNLLGREAYDYEKTAARRLFAEVIDDGMGLQIMTIHAFCQSILGRFPLEANLKPYFNVIEEAESEALLQNAQNIILSQRYIDENTVLKETIDRLVGYINEEQFSQLITDIIKERGQLQHILTTNFGIDGLYQNLCALLECKPGEQEHDIIANAIKNIDQKAMIKIANQLADSSKATDQKNAQKLIAFLEKSSQDQQDDFESYIKIFLTDDFEPRKRLVTKEIIDNHPHILETMQNETERLVTIYDHLKRVQCVQLTTDLLRLGAEIIEEYAKLKAQKAVVDFDDLILKTAELLSKNDIHDWVQYKLDQGLDHILVDEAQDTNPQQWEIIEKLCAEFYAGLNARDDTNRTLFVVGDEKQSIYSFQRASPKAFNDKRYDFAQKFTAAQQNWDDVQLNISFRSTAPVLDIVDSTINNITLYNHAAEEKTEHKSFRTGQGGQCILWPLFEENKREPSDLWEPPIAITENESASSHLANHIAGHIHHQIKTGETLEGYGRAIQPGDIMILVRTRSKFVDELTQALKAYDLPVEGSDRMVLSNQLPVQDLLCLAEFALLPTDDLTLATLLKSPLIGLSEEALFDLCHARQGSLWQNLKETETYQEITAYLTPWIKRAHKMRPFEFLNLALHSPCPADDKSAIRALIKRLGSDARDPIQSLLNEALAFEASKLSTLQSFVHEQKFSQTTIKREMDGQNNNIRIMTIHASKGLQAPIVILPDTMRHTRTPPAKSDFRLFWPLQSDLALPLYAPHKKLEPSLYRDAKERVEQRIDEEYRRLLYVAMTRAEERLYVGGYCGQKKPLEDSWYYDIERGFEALKDSDSMTVLEDGTHIYAMPRIKDPDKAGKGQISKEITAQTLPEWIFSSAETEQDSRQTIIPSRLISDEDDLPAASPFDQADEYRFLRGNITHKLLEFLPDLSSEKREEAAKNFTETYGAALPKTIQAHVVSEVMIILNHPDFAPIFGENSRAEVCIGGALDDNNIINGQIDRLLITDEEILILDYKTNRPPPKTAQDIPPIYLRQMSSYARAIENIYPGRRIRCALLWTDGPHLMGIPDDLLTK